MRFCILAAPPANGKSIFWHQEGASPDGVCRAAKAGPARASRCSHEGLAASPEPIAIATVDLGKRLDRFTALDRLSLAVARGWIFGLLGPNGIGKSTTITILTILLDATFGPASVAAYDVAADPVGVRRRIGYVPPLLSADGALRYPSRGTGNGATGRRLHNVRIPRHQSLSTN